MIQPQIWKEMKRIKLLWKYYILTIPRVINKEFLLGGIFSRWSGHIMCIVKIVCVLIKVLSQKNKIQWSYSSLDGKKKKTWNQGIDTIKLKHREVNKQNAEWHSDPLDTLSYPTHRS